MRWLASPGSWAAILLDASEVFLCCFLLHLQVRFAMALKIMDTACTHFSSITIWSQAQNKVTKA